MTEPTGGRRRRSMPGSGNRGGTYEQMQAVLESQVAANEQQRQTMLAIQMAMNGMLSSMDTMLNPMGGGGSYGAGPHGGRPTMGGNGVRRPTYNPYDPYSVQQHGRGLHGVRHALASNLNERYGTGAGARIDRQVDPTTGAHTGYRITNPDGTVETRDVAWGGSDEGRSALAGAARRGAVGRALGGLAEGGAIGAARAVPYVGAALMGAEAIHEGITMVGNQRAANAQYQSIYGGSNFSQFGQRAQGLGFQLGQLFGGGMTWGQSREAFQGVSAMGYQGQQRSQDLNFITQNYMRMGVSVSDSLKLIQTAAGDLNESLSGLQQGLKNTRSAAIATGQSGNVGTQVFQQTYGQLARNYAGPGVAQIAGALAPMQAGLGRYGVNINLAEALNDPQTTMMLAAHSGMTYTQFVGALQSGSPEDQRRVMRSLDSSFSRAVAPSMGSPEVQNYFNRQLRSMGIEPGSKARMTPDQMNQLAMNLIHDQPGGINIQALQASIQTNTGMKVTPQQAALLAVGQRTGQLFNEKTIANAGLVRSRQTQATSGLVTKLQNYGQVGDARHTNLDINRADPGYLATAVTNANPVIDQMRKSLANTGFNVHKGRAADLEITDAKGNRRVVSYEEAVRDYPEQVATGTAIVMGSGGKTVSEVTGLHADKYVSGRSLVQQANRTGGYHFRLPGEASHGAGTSASTKSGSLSGSGMTAASYQKWYEDKKSHQKAPKGSGGKVIVEASPELRRLLRFTSDSDNVTVANTAAASGSVPMPGLPGS